MYIYITFHWTIIPLCPILNLHHELIYLLEICLFPVFSCQALLHLLSIRGPSLVDSEVFFKGLC